MNTELQVTYDSASKRITSKTKQVMPKRKVRSAFSHSISTKELDLKDALLVLKQATADLTANSSNATTLERLRLKKERQILTVQRAIDNAAENFVTAVVNTMSTDDGDKLVAAIQTAYSADEKTADEHDSVTAIQNEIDGLNDHWQEAVDKAQANVDAITKSLARLKADRDKFLADPVVSA